MSSINFDNAYLLLIAIPLVALLSVPFFIAVRKSNVNAHNVASAVIHVIMALILAFTAAGTTVITTITETNVYVVADVSYSANRNLDKVDEYINNITLPRNTRMGVVAFGKTYRLVTRLGENFSTVKGAPVDDSETDISGALEYTATLFRDGVIKRIVLITDGAESFSNDSSKLKRTVDNLAAQNIHIDAMFLDDNIAEGAEEVQVTSVEYTANAYLGHKSSAIGVIQSGFETDAIVTLSCGIFSEPVSVPVRLTTGSNSVSFDNLYTEQPGTYEYTLSVRADGDLNPNNNEVKFTQVVSDSVNILLVTENTADLNAVAEVYGKSDRIYAPLLQGERVPYTVEALCAYDEIIISDVDVSESVANYEMFLESVDTVVSLFGKSLLTMGNTGIQNDFEGKLKRLDNMLPVNYGNGNAGKKLYTIVLDISRSMGSLYKYDRAQKAALQLLELLNDEDRVNIIAFYGSFKTLYYDPVTYNRSEARERITEIKVSDLEQGTMMSGALNDAFEKIKASDYKEKQLMLITDGLTYSNETDDPLTVTRNMRANGITVSVLDVGRGANQDATSTAAKQTLENVASIGGGKYFLVDDEEKLQDVIFGEIPDDLRETVVDRSSNVTLALRRDEAAAGITDFSYVGGYMNSRSKASANTVLTVEYYAQGGGAATVPLYAYWKYGNGKVASFTSRLSGSWISPWKQSEGPYKAFFGNVISAMTPDEKIDYPFVSEVRAENGYAVVDITPATVRADASAKISIVSPSGELTEGEMLFDSSVYAYRILTPSTGNYEITVTYSYGDKDYVSKLNYTLSYLPEYNSFAVFDAAGLNRVIGTDGTVTENGKLEIINDDKELGTYTLDLTVPLLIVCVVLFAVDIIIRKLKWSDIVSLFRKVKK